MRYVVKDGIGNPHRSTYYVYDTVKDQVVWTWSVKYLANQMCQDLNEIDRESRAVPEDVVQRMRLEAAVCDIRAVELFDRADAAEKRGALQVQKESEAEGAKLRQRARDIYALLKAAGVELES